MTDQAGRNTLYQLLPAVFRIRDDATDGGPLKALLEAIEVQADAADQDIARVYDNWFIETCDDDLVPYFAGLVGLDLGPAVGSTSEAEAGVDAVWRRRQVANAIADRRRKGTFSVLAQLAADATGWPARAIELDRVVMATQSVRFPDVGRRALVDVGDADVIALMGSPLSDAAPLPDVRRSSSPRTPGTVNPGSVGVWLWRLVADQVQHAPAAPTDDYGRYTFDQLGRDLRLAVLPPVPAPSTPSTLLDVAVPITRSALRSRLEDFYGPGRSICVYQGGRAVPRSQILVADLGREHGRTRAGHVSIDPERGRIAFHARDEPEGAVYVTYSRLEIGAIGGGGYERQLAPEPQVYRVAAGEAGAHRTVGAALKAWRAAKARGPVPSAAIEISDDGVYEEQFEIDLAPGERLEIRAAQGRRPILIPRASGANRPDRFRVRGLHREKDEGEADAALDGPPVIVFDGVWIAGDPLELLGHLGGVKLRHCTLVPAGRAPGAETERDRRGVSILVRARNCPISIVSCVLGRIRVESPEAGLDPIPVSIEASVLDASEPGGRAVLGDEDRPAWVSLSVQRVTVLGGAHVHSVELVEDSIFTGPIDLERRQRGTVRYSFIPPGSSTPRRIRCQPDDGVAAAEAAAAGRPTREREFVVSEALERLAPRFDGANFGDPAFARLSFDAAPELTQGAHDGGEMGAYHDLWQALRVADLGARLQEFTPAGADIDIRFAS